MSERRDPSAPVPRTLDRGVSADSRPRRLPARQTARLFVGVVLVLVLSAPLDAVRTARQTGIPAGTHIAIRLIDAIDSQTADPTTEYRATVDDPVMVDGTVVAPIGSQAWLRAVSVIDAGAVRGRVTMALKLVAIEIDGRALTVHTSDAAIQSNSQAGNTTKKSVVGGIVGGVVGGILAGPSDAVAGASAGVATGVAVAMATGPRIRVPKETRMSFTIEVDVVPGAPPEKLPPGVRTVFDAILDTEAQSRALANQGDWLALDRLLDPTYTGSINGQPVSREAFLAGVRAHPEIIASSLEVSAFSLEGDQAALSGTVKLQVRRGSLTSAMTQRFTGRFVRGSTGWLLLRSDVLR